MSQGVVYPGSFDPITYGHIDLIKRAGEIFSEVVVAVLVNRNKKTLFSVEQRVSLAQEALRGMKGVRVVSFDGLLVDFMSEYGYRAVLRGARSAQEFETEASMAQINRRLNPTVETIILSADPALSVISSSVARELASFGGDLSFYVPAVCEHALLSAFGNT